MKEIAIYLEGGGDTVQQETELRLGMDALLDSPKQAARAKKLGWRTIPCGGRQQTFDAFQHALQTADEETVLILLVDSEDGIAPEARNAEAANALARVQHLTQREGWNLADVAPGQVHLMVRCMEAWIVADGEALADYYGKGFHAKSLPNRHNLEDEPKPDLLDKLKKATQKTQKGEYAKIKHASQLLGRVDPAKIGQRCPRFRTFTAWLSKQIGDA
jgi:Domain of unknown function (DUF4276)